MSTRPSALDLRDLNRLLDEEEYDFLSRPSTSASLSTRARPASSRSAARPPLPSGGGRDRFSLGAPTLRGGGGESTAAAAVGGGGGVFLDTALESPRGHDTPLPVIFIKEQEVASTCRGTYSATSRFCIKKILPVQHHCGISSHKNKKYPVKGDTYWAPGGYVRGALVAMCGECVEASKIPPSMMELFGDSELRTSTEWRNIIVDASMPTPSLPSTRVWCLS